MKRFCLIALLFVVAFAPVDASTIDGIALTSGTTVVFASVEKGREILTARDGYIKSFSRFDRQARMMTDGDVTDAELRENYRKSVMPWTDSLKRGIIDAFEVIAPALRELAPPLPPTVYLILTDGSEESGAGYTRGDAIGLPRQMAEAPASAMPHILAHELFHIVSRRDPELRYRLYEVIGYEKCEEVALPESLAALKIANPDAPRNDCVIPITHDGKAVLALPLIHSREPYDAKRGGGFMRYMRFDLMLVERDKAGKPRALLNDGEPVLLRPKEAAGFFEKIGRNTGYNIHAEETIAENFALLVEGRRKVPSPEILAELERVLREERPETTKQRD